MLKSYTLATWCEEVTHWKTPWFWERLRAGGEGDDRGWDGWMASLTQWTWVWAGSRSWWRTGKPGVLQFMGLQRVGHDSATEPNPLNSDFLLSLFQPLVTVVLLSVFMDLTVLCVQVKLLQSCLTVCDTTGCSPSGSSVRGILQATILELVARPASRRSSQPRDWTHVSRPPTSAGRFFTTSATWEALDYSR